MPTLQLSDSSQLRSMASNQLKSMWWMSVSFCALTMRRRRRGSPSLLSSLFCCLIILVEASWEHTLAGFFSTHQDVFITSVSCHSCRVTEAWVPVLSPSTYSSSAKVPARLGEAASYIWGSWRFIEALLYPKYSPETSYGTRTPCLRLHWSWETFRDEVLKKSKKKGPSCLGKKVVGMTL